MNSEKLLGILMTLMLLMLFFVSLIVSVLVFIVLIGNYPIVSVLVLAILVGVWRFTKSGKDLIESSLILLAGILGVLGFTSVSNIGFFVVISVFFLLIRYLFLKELYSEKMHGFEEYRLSFSSNTILRNHILLPFFPWYIWTMEFVCIKLAEP